ncbi:hypothetical protein SSS_00388 [Sarcoptes scabiei]|nr:hypothetical protein SSS_00388 [Sarcoptes scabiei]
MGNLFTDGLINGLYAIGGCSHARSIELIIAYAYEDSRNDFQVMAYRCPRYQDYDEGRCSRCDSSLDCVRFGHWFEYWLERKKPPVNSNATRIYRMNTRKSMPYSLHAYGFEIQTGRNFIPFRGSLRLSMTGSLRNDHIAHFDWLGNFKPRKTYTALFTYRKTLGKILTINATLTSGGNLKLPAIASKIKVRKIIVRYMNGFEKSFREQYSSILYPLKHKSTIEGRHKQTMFLSEDSDPKSQPNGREPLEPL